MRIVVVISFFGVATTALVGYDYQHGTPGSADLPYNSDYPNVGSLELNTFAPNSGVDVYALGVGLNKEFYHYSAPDEDIASEEVSHPAIRRVKKNLRVIFIKAPENNGAAKAALQLAKEITSDQTAIYVLSKQPDVSDLAKEIKDLREAVSHKPEVRFVKYKTPEEAVSLQLGIQQQYETLRGTSRSIYEAAAPVLDFSSSPQTDENANVLPEEYSEGSSLTPHSEMPLELVGLSDGRTHIPPA